MSGEDQGEKCVRCGDTGYDRRTLWMACMYAMNELSIPLERCQLNGTRHKYEGEKMLESFRLSIPQFAEEPSGEPAKRNFFTLRVCKGCRAEWMSAIERWFKSGSRPRRTGSACLSAATARTTSCRRTRCCRTTSGWSHREPPHLPDDVGCGGRTIRRCPTCCRALELTPAGGEGE